MSNMLRKLYCHRHKIIHCKFCIKHNVYEPKTRVGRKSDPSKIRYKGDWCMLSHKPTTNINPYTTVICEEVKKISISDEEKNRILASQNWKCAICDPDTCDPGQALEIDHDHATGNVREGLCRRHNSGIGFFRDSPDEMISAINYLIKHGKIATWKIIPPNIILNPIKGGAVV